MALPHAVSGGPLGPVRAEAQEREPPPEAVEFYRRGREHYRAGRYREAIVDLERALALDPVSPTLTYNLGRVHELLAELDEAIEYYERYVRLLPEDEAEERARIEETIRRLRGAQEQVGSGEPAPAPPATPPDAEEDEEPRYVTERGIADAPFWIAAGTSAALLVGGAIVGIVAVDRDAAAASFTLGSDGNEEEWEALADEADQLALTSDVLLIAGAAAGLTAMLLYALRTRTTEVLPDHQGTTPFVATDGQSALLGLRGRL